MLQEELDINNTLIAMAFIAIAVIIGVIALFAQFMSKKNKLVNKQLRAELDYQNRLHQSELKALRGQMNPHFVHNSINAIQYYVQRNEVEISEHYLSKFSKLLRLFFDYSRRQFVSISEEVELLKNYLEIEKLRFEDKIEYEITVDPKIDTEEARLPSMMIQPLVENSINHGLFHKQGKGLVTIQFTYINPTSYRVIVEDNGIGITKTLAFKNNELEKETAHSSNILAERVELLNLSNDWKVDFKMEDLTESTDQSGTKVSLTFSEILDAE